jgi:predicted nucleotidyltransferase
MRGIIYGKYKEIALIKFVKTPKERYKGRIKKIILFGSYARGDYDEESDIDILIIGDVPQREVSFLSAEILLKYWRGYICDSEK